jgi:hypothetical protein
MLVGTLLSPALAQHGARREVPIDGYGSFRLRQEVPRMQLGRFLPAHPVAEAGGDSYEERFSDGRMLRVYRCLDKLALSRKEDLTVALTVSTVDGKIHSIVLQTDFTFSEQSSETDAKQVEAAGRNQAEPLLDWDARRSLATSTFRSLLDNNYLEYLKREVSTADVEQRLDGGGPFFLSAIGSEDGGESLVMLLYPEHPMMRVEYSTKLWQELGVTEAKNAVATAGQSDGGRGDG